MEYEIFDIDIKNFFKKKKLLILWIDYHLKKFK
jgi:hypothetical protein